MGISPGAKIKELRTIAGLSQEELGRRVGVQRAAINKYERGTVENIPIKTIEKIANALEVSPTYIVGWSESSSNPLSAELKVLQGVKRFYGRDCVDLLENYINLNSKRKRSVQQYVSDMNFIQQTETFLSEAKIDDVPTVRGHEK